MRTLDGDDSKTLRSFGVVGRPLSPADGSSQARALTGLLPPPVADWMCIEVGRSDEGRRVGDKHARARDPADALTPSRAPQVSNTDPTPAFASGAFTDTSAAPKFELTDDEYAQRRDTVQAYLRSQRLGPKFGAPASEPGSPKPAVIHEVPAGLEVGKRCEVDGVGRGEVRFVGKTAGADGVYVGVNLDEPVGKNDGRCAGPLASLSLLGRFVG